eukprot:5603455-Amphidinium_carterae.1
MQGCRPKFSDLGTCALVQSCVDFFQLLDMICAPSFFERLIVMLIVLDYLHREFDDLELGLGASSFSARFSS